MLLQILYYIPIVFALIIIGTFALYRKSSSGAWQFAAMAYTISLWLLAQYFIQINLWSQSLLFAQITGLLSCFIALTFLLFSVEYVARGRIANRRSFKYILYPSYLLIAVFTFTSFSKLGIQNINITSTGFAVQSAGSLYNVQAIILSIIMFIGFGIILKDTFDQKKADRTRNYVLIAALLQAAVITAVVNTVFQSVAETQLLIPFSMLILVSLIAYAVFKHKLFDVRLIIVRSVAYILTLASIVAVYSLIVFVLFNNLLAGKIGERTQQSLYIITVIFFGFTLPPLKRFFDHITTALFFRDAYDTQEVLDEIGKIIVGNIDLHKIEKTSLTVLSSALRTTYLGFVFKGEAGLVAQDFIGESPQFDQAALQKSLTNIGRKEVVYDEIEQSTSEKAQLLRKNDISLVIPLITKNETIGYLISGPKKSGNIFNQQDRGMLNIAANELAVALQNAQRFEEIQAFNLTLQEKVDEATKELKKTNKKLLELDEAKDEFISMASHQLRTPLTSIKGYLSMLMDGDLGKVSKEQNQALKEAFTSSQRMVFLISDFLNVSRIKTGKFVIEPKEINLSDMIKEELVQLREMAEAKQLKMIYEPPADFPVVKLDENKMHQVMMNMMDNAIYYTPNSGTITIQLYIDGKDVVFKVIDTGIGVPKAEQHKLFTKFFRAGNARKTRPDGTGLGLFMAQKVVVAQAGSIIFESEEGKGSTFGFRFTLSSIKA